MKLDFDDDVLAFRDVRPVAPTHVLVIPKKHIVGISDAKEDEATILGKVLLGARAVALQEGLGGIRDVLLDRSQPIFLDKFARVDGRSHPSIGDTIVISPKQGHVHAFDTESGERLDDKAVISA